jgi:hypothetical protein
VHNNNLHARPHADAPSSSKPVSPPPDTPATVPFAGAGIYSDMPEAVYHADPVPDGSLSSTGARRLLSCPARFQYERENPPEPSDAMEFGTAAHRVILGAGRELKVIEHASWLGKTAQEERKAARAADLVPVLRKDYELLNAMAPVIKDHPIAGLLLDPASGSPEQSLFWQDGETGVWCRSRVDFMPAPDARRQYILPDYKTCAAADRASLAKAVVAFGYHQQAAWYLAGAQALGLHDGDARFVFVAQEKTPPHLVTCFELSQAAINAGHALNRAAIERYRDCTEAGEWPGYGPASEVEIIDLPAWYYAVTRSLAA